MKQGGWQICTASQPKCVMHMPEESMGIHLLREPPCTHWKCDMHRYAWKVSCLYNARMAIQS